MLNDFDKSYFFEDIIVRLKNLAKSFIIYNL